MNGTALELIKSFGPPLLTFVIGAIGAATLSVHWALVQKRRELQLNATNDFYNLYGEFFAVWKLSKLIAPFQDSNQQRMELLKRASTNEGKMEAILVHLATQRRLTPRERRSIGCFRQAYQQLRERMLHNLGCWSAAGHPEYAAFKRSGASVVQMLSDVKGTRPPTREEARRSLFIITANYWEKHWTEEDGYSDEENREQGHSVRISCQICYTSAFPICPAFLQIQQLISQVLMHLPAFRVLSASLHDFR